MKVIGSVFLFVLIFSVSCKRSPDIKTDHESKTRERYFNLENKGWKSFTHTQVIEEINYTATEVPIAYYILKSSGTDNLVLADSLEKANSKERIIEFEFLHDEEQDLLKNMAKTDYEEAVKYLSFNIKDDFYLVTARHDTIRTSGVLFERTFNVSPSNKILLFYTGVESNQPVQLIYEDKLFGRGTLKFKFEEKITKILL